MKCRRTFFPYPVHCVTLEQLVQHLKSGVCVCVCVCVRLHVHSVHVFSHVSSMNIQVIANDCQMYTYLSCFPLLLLLLLLMNTPVQVQRRHTQSNIN